MKLEVIHRSPQGNAKATPLLFVHGKWHGAWCWDEYFLPYFAEHGYNSYALSLRGHGTSVGKIWGASIADYVNDVAQTASQFDTPPVIIGHSMGGFITQKYLETRTAPAAVLLTSVPYYGLWPATFSLLMQRPLAVLKVLGTLRLYPVVETPALAQHALFSKDMPAVKVAAYQKRLSDESFRSYLDELGLNLARPKQIKTPMLVIGAANDNVISHRDVEATARAYGTKAEFFNMAHDVMLEANWKPAADRIIGWLQEKGL
ncbi:MAG: alpha/beta fold hydrolase [Chloroflexi bacterium]|nr:alpha/beta fold hydrolase [Chloroflexota bacterium]